MVVTTENYGTMVTHTGTRAEVMGAIKGKPPSDVIQIYYNGSNITAVVKNNPSLS